MEKLNLMELFLDYEFKWHSEKEFLEKIAPDMEQCYRESFLEILNIKYEFTNKQEIDF